MLTLPGDVLYIILDLLKAERDHSTLFQCALSSRWLAEPSLSVLYQWGYYFLMATVTRVLIFDQIVRHLSRIGRWYRGRAV